MSYMHQAENLQLCIRNLIKNELLNNFCLLPTDKEQTDCYITSISLPHLHPVKFLNWNFHCHVLTNIAVEVPLALFISISATGKGKQFLSQYIKAHQLNVCTVKFRLPRYMESDLEDIHTELWNYKIWSDFMASLTAWINIDSAVKLINENIAFGSWNRPHLSTVSEMLLL